MKRCLPMSWLQAVRRAKESGRSMLQPWYIRRPSQAVRRLVYACRRSPPSRRVVRVPWGATIRVDGRDAIGRAILHTGSCDPCVCEVLARLASISLLSVDVGANIGCMTSVLAKYSRSVVAFEPHPMIHGVLAENMRLLRGRRTFGPCTVHAVALSDREGEGWLYPPVGWVRNRGMARLERSGYAGAIRVATARLDRFLSVSEVGVMKVDVEGHELGVFRGSARSLAAGRIRHIVYEDHAGPESEASRFLAAMGYAIFPILGARFWGPLLGVAGAQCEVGHGAPSYVATRDPEECLARCRRRGWLTIPWSLE